MPIINDWLHSLSLKVVLPIMLRYRDIFNGEWNGKKTVCISFDCDFPEDMLACPSVLSLLNKEHIISSFALAGSVAIQFPKIVEAIITEGHDVINHTLSHPSNFRRFGIFQKKREIQGFQKIMTEMFNYTPQCFRSPHGMRRVQKSFFPMLAEIGLFDSSFLGYGVLNVENVLEVPLTPCPEHPQTSFDSSHHFRLPLFSSSLKKFLRLWDLILDQNVFVNIFLDPRDLLNGELLEKMLQSVKANGFDFCSLNEIYKRSQEMRFAA